MSKKIKYFENFIKEDISEYRRWKRKNVTLRGIKELGKPNNVYGSFGNGLYTAALSNKKMAREYGDVYFVVNAIPKKPKIVNSLNEAEIFIHSLINNFCKDQGKEYDKRFFNTMTTIENEMIKLGYDGLIIKGREMVNYKPVDVKYFKSEDELKDYYQKSLNLF